MNNSKFFILSPLLFFIIFLVAEAQVSSVGKGDKIRVTAPGEYTGKRTGIVTDVTGDSLEFIHGDSGIHVSLTSIKKLEISTGQRRNAGRGALIGAGSLGITFGLLAMSSDTDCSNEEGWCLDLFSRKDAFYMGLFSGSVIGGVTGAIIGHFTLRDRWEKIELKPISLVLHSNKRIPAVGIRLRLLLS